MLLVKLLVVILLLFIVVSLFSGMYFMLKDPSNSDRAIKALSFRIGLSLVVFLLLMIAYGTGLLTPNGGQV